MKVIAYTALHYGAEYLAYAIKSVIDHVDEYHVLYSAEGSHGWRTEERCPDTAQQLYDIARAVAGHKLHWTNGKWPYEGAQRDYIHQLVPDADVILVLDSDEIWQPKLIERIIHYSGKVQYSAPVRTLRLPMLHYWRSFHKAIVNDPAWPERIIFPRINPRYGDGTWSRGVGWINHMGYAQRSEIVRYKLLTHGHRGEFRRDVDWFTDKFMANAQIDCHPVGSEYWNPEPVNPMDYMPDFMKSHPNYRLEVIP